jgi:hypothetical protein
MSAPGRAGGTRRPIGKRLRFEIFKRDRFRCVYCGRTPTEAVLEVDHLVPVAGGGTDDPANLFTACRDCNSGRSDRPLTSALPQVRRDEIEELAERVEQMRAYQAWRAEFENALGAEISMRSTTRGSASLAVTSSRPTGVRNTGPTSGSRPRSRSGATSTRCRPPRSSTRCAWTAGATASATAMPSGGATSPGTSTGSARTRSACKSRRHRGLLTRRG